MGNFDTFTPTAKKRHYPRVVASFYAYLLARPL